MTKKAKSKIIQKDNPVLRRAAITVPKKDFGTRRLNTVLRKMTTALHGEKDGVAIAAPQIGESLRIFIVSGRVFSMQRGEDNRLHDTKDVKKVEDMVFVNPRIIKLSRKKKEMEEGCLSVRWLYGKVRRSEKATVHAWDKGGNAFTLGASGLLAQIFQHEIDHLDGILFIDKATDLEEIPPPKTKRKTKNK